MKGRGGGGSIAAAIAATLCWGAGTPLSKLALEHFEPTGLLTVQLLSSIAFLLFLQLILRSPVGSWRKLAGYSALGILEPGLAYFLGLFGLNYISAAEAVVLFSTESILIILLAWLLTIERPRGYVVLLAIVGTCGAMLVTGSHIGKLDGRLSLWGDLLVLAGVLSAAGYVVWSSRLAAQIEPLPVLVGQQLVALLFALGMHLALGADAWAGQVPATGWALAALSGVLQYACAFWLYLWALKGLRTDEAGLYLCLIPMFGLLIAVPLLGERLGAIQWVGAALIVGSIIVLARFRQEPDRHREAPTPVA